VCPPARVTAPSSAIEWAQPAFALRAQHFSGSSLETAPHFIPRGSLFSPRVRLTASFTVAAILPPRRVARTIPPSSATPRRGTSTQVGGGRDPWLFRAQRQQFDSDVRSALWSTLALGQLWWSALLDCGVAAGILPSSPAGGRSNLVSDWTRTSWGLSGPTKSAEEANSIAASGRGEGSVGRTRLRWTGAQKCSSRKASFGGG
jgi:hypothetical protein